MYNLLVVDDEEIAIRGIVQGIDWSSLPFSNVFTAYDADEARQIFQTHAVHVLISDIDMPRENGIKLLNWVNENSPQTETIFLTGHADFGFAQQAVQLGSFDYLLKPIDHDVLKTCVEKAVNTIRDREEDEAFRKTYEYYFEQWNRQLPLLVERFWQDVINLRIPATSEQLEPLFKLYGIDLDMQKHIVPLLISVEEWRQEWSARDEEIMTYALRNAAEDILLRNQPGHIFQDPNGMLFALLYNPEEGQEAVLEERCREYIRKCGEYLYAVVSCYIGEAVQVAGLRVGVQQLAEMERSNIGQTGSVFRLSAFRRPRRTTAASPNFQEWAALVETGKKTELESRIGDFFDRLMPEQVDHPYMVNYYFGLVHVIFQLLQRRSISPPDIYPEDEWRKGEHAMKSLGAMKAWTIEFIRRAADYLGKQGREVSGTIMRVQHYIEENLQLDLNREAIAEHVYLNPAYLSRLFRKETGMSLTDYTVELRMQRAKLELERTNNKISDIATSIGYSNFSHFSKLFKKMTGLTPQEYRKKYQEV